MYLSRILFVIIFFPHVGMPRLQSEPPPWHLINSSSSPYQSAWPDFCFQHVFQYCLGCDDEPSADDAKFFQLTSEEICVFILSQQGTNAAARPISKNILKSGPIEFRGDVDVLSIIKPYHKFLPRYNHYCAFLFCHCCDTPIALKLGLKKGYPTIFHSCECSSKVYTDDDVIVDKAPDSWEGCYRKAVCSKYFDVHCKEYSRFLKKHLVYCRDNPSCKCYWPEHAIKGAGVNANNISRRAHSEVNKCLLYGALSQLINRKIPDPDFPYLEERSLHGVASGLLIHAFFYTDYHQIFSDIARWVEKHEVDNAKAVETIESIQRTLSYLQDDYLKLYTACIEKHPHPKVYYERGMVYFEKGLNIEAIEDVFQLARLSKESPKHKWRSANLYLIEGTSYAELGLYDKAVEVFTKVIEKDPDNKEAYLGRSLCYLEQGDIAGAHADFLASKYSSTPIDNTNVSQLEFATGFIQGATTGLNEALFDLIPATLASIRGIGHGLWVLTIHPEATSQQFIDNCINIVQLLRSADDLEKIKLIQPDLGSLIESWNEVPQKERGQRLGTLIGKYGVDILAVGGAVKVIKSLRMLKQADAVLTMEQLTRRAGKSRIIHKYSKKWWKKTRPLVEDLKKNGGRFDQKLATKFRHSPLTESQVRKILHTGGFKTFSRPKGLPSCCHVEISQKGGGMIYRKIGTTEKQNILVRVMPGNPKSPNPRQHKPYVVQRRGNQAILKNNKLIDPDLPEAHIPLAEFQFQGW